MSRWHRSAPWIVFGVIVVLSLVSLAVSWQDQGLVALVAVASVSVGTLILVRSRNRIGWLFDVAAAAGLLLAVCEAYLFRHATTSPGLPGAGYAAIIDKIAVYPGLMALALILLWFPDGRPPSPRWTPVTWLIVGATTLVSIGAALTPGTTDANHAAGIPNPLGVSSMANLALILSRVGGLGLFVGFIACVVSLVVRFRRSSGDERQQLRWLSVVGAVALIGFVLAGFQDRTGAPVWVGAVGWDVMLLCFVVGIPAAVTIAILKYHLYDIDLVIRKAVVFGLLAVFITGVYAAIVGLVSATFERQGSFIAAAALAILFAPARDRARKIADRLVYGKRATPYEVLAEFSDRVGEAYAAEDVLNRMAQVLMEGTGAVGARVLLNVGGDQRAVAAVGEEGDETEVQVTHQGDDLGALAVSMPPSDPMNPTRLRLVEDLAAQAGLVLRNVRLIEELKASRQRLVAAQDEERRKLERNLHDGAQQQLVALAVKQRLLGHLIGRDDDKAKAMVGQLAGDTNDALENLRDLARGIYPPLLADRGLVAALEAQARKAAVPTAVDGNGIGRFGQDVEAAVYFSCLEALQNVAKYAGASRATIALSNGNGALRFTVSDDGTGFDTSRTSYGTGLQGIADRLAALSGDLQIRSAPGEGTSVTGIVPIREVL